MFNKQTSDIMGAHFLADLLAAAFFGAAFLATFLEAAFFGEAALLAFTTFLAAFGAALLTETFLAAVKVKEGKVIIKTFNVLNNI
tara:strand:+ start:720 stop:974 length:255 start_codon:yes stop_codon:yes gene_type:complete